MNLFRSEEHVRRWARGERREPGAVVRERVEATSTEAASSFATNAAENAALWRAMAAG